MCEIGVGFSAGFDGGVLGAGVCEMEIGFAVPGIDLGEGVDGTGLGAPVCETGVGFIAGLDGDGLGPDVCETGVIPPVSFFARPGGLQPDDPGEQPHPVLLP